MQLTLFRFWWFIIHPRLSLRDRIIVGMWRAEEDTVAICDLLFMAEHEVSNRVRQLRKNGIALAKRVGGRSASKWRATLTERPCISCDKPFLSEGIHNRMCGPCKGVDDHHRDRYS